MTMIVLIQIVLLSVAMAQPRSGDNRLPGWWLHVTPAATEFTCSDKTCIPSIWRCDGDSDCADRSDEVGCKDIPRSETLNQCADNEFACGDHTTCIHHSWVCDGDRDCLENSDEAASKCHPGTCRPDQFQCADKSCIPGNLYCDGVENCPDGGDEKDCTEVKIVCDPLKQFDCGNRSCIALSSVCDGKPDCVGWEDEQPPLCGKNECLNNNGGCSQTCVDLPIGYRCECRQGYKLINNRTCDDIDECMEPGSCSQFCLNEKGGFKCSCASGYDRDPRDLTRCKATEGHASLLLARRRDIRKVALDGQEMTAIVNNTRMATALDFVFKTGMIFWSDISEKKIYKAAIDEGNVRAVVIDRDLSTSDGLAVDWIYNHIYWTDVEKSTIELANFEGNMRKTLISDHVQMPRAIAVDPLEGWMYWTDWGDDARIERAGMDGSYRSIIVENDEVKWPNGLTLDLVGEKLYWVDAKLNTIASCNYDGSGRRTILYSRDLLGHPFSITTFEDYIYWTDWNKEAIFKANKFTGKDVEAVTSLRSGQLRPMAVHVYHPYRQPDGTNQCQAVNGHCSHLCLPAPRIHSKSPLLSCACPDGLRLLPNGLMCVENETKTVAPTTQVVTVPFTKLEPPKSEPEIHIDKTTGSPFLPPSAPCLLRARPVVERDDYTYTPGVGAHKCHTRKAKWNVARKTCEAEGGHLAIINSVAEANAIADVFRKSGYPGNWVLIGMHDLFEEGEFVTVHGQSIAEAGFTGWAANEPDRGTEENCGAISKIGEIVDIACYVEFGFICESPVN